MAQGVFITFEGIDGCGKSTHVRRLVALLEERGLEVVALREPGGTDISEKIRDLLLDPSNTEMCDECELLLYEASRAQLVRQTILPALERGAVVVCDRFYDSTFAYQARARGLDAEVVSRANALGSCGLVPTRTVVFDLDPDAAKERSSHYGEDRLELEGVAFQRRVYEAYHELATAEPDRVRLLDCSGTHDQTFSRLLALLGDLLPLDGVDGA